MTPTDPIDRLVEAVRPIIKNQEDEGVSQLEFNGWFNRTGFPALKTALAAAEEWQKGVGPIVMGDGETHWYGCPECKEPLAPKQKHCGDCGIRLNWKEGKDE